MGITVASLMFYSLCSVALEQPNSCFCDDDQLINTSHKQHLDDTEPLTSCVRQKNLLWAHFYVQLKKNFGGILVKLLEK